MSDSDGIRLSFSLHVGLVSLSDKSTFSSALGSALRFEFVGVDRGSGVGRQVEVPRFGVSLFDFEEANGKLLINSGVIVVHVESLLGPVGYSSSSHSLNADVSTVVLQPVVVDGSKTLGTLAAEIVSGEGDVGPPIVGEGDFAGNSLLFEGGERQNTHLIGLSLMFVPFSLLAPVVVIGEVPLDGWLVVEHLHFDGVARVASPHGRGLSQRGLEEAEEDESHVKSGISHAFRQLIYINRYVGSTKIKAIIRCGEICPCKIKCENYTSCSCFNIWFGGSFYSFFFVIMKI